MNAEYIASLPTLRYISWRYHRGDFGPVENLESRCGTRGFFAAIQDSIAILVDVGVVRYEEKNDLAREVYEILMR